MKKYYINSSRIFFAQIALFVCGLLSLRPIPLVDSLNDTGRYIYDFSTFCSGNAVQVELENREISYNLFFFILSPACYDESRIVFLLIVAFFLPLAFLLFSRWTLGTALWAYSLLFSIYALELMTNAMRQGLAMLLFFGALSTLNRGKWSSFVFAILSVLAHTSVLPYIPLLLWISKIPFRKFMAQTKYLFTFLVILALVSLYFISNVSIDLGSLELWVFYLNIYEDTLSLQFLLYIVMPLYGIYGIRFMQLGLEMPEIERKAFLYSSALIILCILFFPAITYRFAIFSVPLQVFLVTMSIKTSIKSGLAALMLFSFHLFSMLVVSKNYVIW